jgi:hypothetical protein
MGEIVGTGVSFTRSGVCSTSGRLSQNGPTNQLSHRGMHERVTRAGRSSPAVSTREQISFGTLLRGTPSEVCNHKFWSSKQMNYYSAFYSSWSGSSSYFAHNSAANTIAQANVAMNDSSCAGKERLLGVSVLHDHDWRACQL